MSLEMTVQEESVVSAPHPPSTSHRAGGHLPMPAASLHVLLVGGLVSKCLFMTFAHLTIRVICF